MTPPTSPSPNQPLPSASKAWARALSAIKLLEAPSPPTLPGLVDRLALVHRDRPALLGETETLTYRALAGRANRYARWIIAQGAAPGDVVGLLAANSPDYVAIWLGLTRAGCAVALINTNLAGDALLHSIKAAAPSHLIVSDSLLPPLTALASRLPPDTRVWVHSTAPAAPWPRIAPDLLPDNPAQLEPGERLLPNPQDPALLIYTSGTTGLPKAAHVSHARIMEWSLWFAAMMDAQPHDRLYDCLPMYHSTGGVVAIGAMLASGGSVLIRRRFSATGFWDDAADNGCTIIQYIGELCRYLTFAPPHPKERAHRIRLACGNGLHKEVWQTFQQRFAIPQILEFYAATEGVVSLYNAEGKPGAVGRIPPFLGHRFPVALIRSDPDSGEPLRDAAGLCIPCQADEPGEAVGRQSQSSARPFNGYTDRAASARKLLHDVFENGDRWFRTGDLMQKDAAGYYYFVGRMGDTFRWQGENVAAAEVEAALRACPGVTAAAVYGVAVPGHDGRACMAAITTRDGFDLAGLSGQLAARLPAYAQPVFIRCCRTLEMTATFKLAKHNLAREGYLHATDPVWFNDRRPAQCIPLDAALLHAIATNARRI